jgi:hypothetical protein
LQSFLRARSQQKTGCTIVAESAFVFFLLVNSVAVFAQTDAEKPVPVLTGSVGFFGNRDAGQNAVTPVFSPVLLVPLGNRWLIESRAEFDGEFQVHHGTPSGQLEKELDYAQIDYIANRYITITAGRFLNPFGIYNERLYPIWIRKLETIPLIFPIGTGSGDGLMLRGGLALNPKANLNYAAYFSTLSTLNKLDSDRLTGGRIGFFLPGPRLEFGTSFQQLLQEDRSRSIGFHFAWQPSRTTLNFRSEYAWSGSKGSGYWIEAAYGLNQISHWRRMTRHLEFVGRAQEYLPGKLDFADAAEYGLPQANTREGDLGVNYYFRDGLKATASYGRKFISVNDTNVWSVGIGYRFLLPLGRTGGQ